MIDSRAALVLLTIAASGLAACGPFRSRPPQRQDLVVLLPESDGTTGRADVSNSAGKTELSSPRSGTRVAPGQAPTPAAPVSEADVKRIFGDALAAQPPAAIHYTLYFEFDSDELTAESRKLLQEVLQTVKTYPTPHVTVIGHTDTTGPAAVNVQLGLRRATVVRTMLVDTGLDGAQIDATSHGEATPLVKTADEVTEPKNRRVEITVR